MPDELPPGRLQRASSGTLVLVAIVLLAVNLRPVAVSIGPVLDEIRAGLGMSAVGAGMLTALPVLSFATVGAVAPLLARLVGMHKLTLLALVAVCGGVGVRAIVNGTAAFLSLSFLALAGMAVANVLMPSLVKLHFPERVGQLTAVYSTALALGLTSASVLTVPIAKHGSGAIDWRQGLFVWALVAAVAIVPWLGLLRHDRAPEILPHPIRARDVARTRLGWVMAIFFGLQSLQAYSVFGWGAQIYRDAGFSAETAGLLLGVVTGVSIPLSYVIPLATAREGRQRGIVIALMACYPIAYLGLLVAPHAGAVIWAVVLGIGLTTFPFILTLIGLRARTSEGVAALSGWTQSVGYLIAAAGPFAVGALYDATNAWAVPITMLLLLSLAQFAVGIKAAHPTYLEDELAAVRNRVPDNAA